MLTEHWIGAISRHDYDLPFFVQLAVEDENAREEIVRQMCHYPAIMVYYHCFEVLKEASSQHPDLFFPFWGEIAALLQHPNSYHRDFAVELLANLASADRDDRFALCADGYFAILADEKFMTANLCLRNLLKICRAKPALQRRILDTLLAFEQHSPYTPKQTALLQADILEILDAVYAGALEKECIQAFIFAQQNSLSPKTRRTAKALAREYGTIA